MQYESQNFTIRVLLVSYYYCFKFCFFLSRNAKCYCFVDISFSLN